SRLLTDGGALNKYDELSNIFALGANVFTYQTTGPNTSQMNLSSFFDGSNTWTYDYDANDNVIDILNVNHTLDRFTHLLYDNLNGLREIDFKSGQVDLYWYNKKGLRHKKEEHHELGVGASTVTYTLYLGELPIIVETYVGGSIFDTQLNPIGDGGVAPVTLGHYRKVYSAGENLELFYNDDLGSRRAVISSLDVLLDSFTYSSWGVATHQSGPTSDSYLASFTGKSYDDTGLIYFNARYYDPTTGRFLTEDPSRQGVNWYAYCDNDPINRTDPTGMDVGDKAIYDAGGGPGWRVPIGAGTLTSAFGLRHDVPPDVGPFHSGVDFAAPRGSPTVAAARGTVIQAGWNARYGNTVVVRHPDGSTSVEMHLDTITVVPGQRVYAGQQTGTVGSTGRLAHGLVHLHFSLIPEGAPVPNFSGEEPFTPSAVNQTDPLRVVGPLPTSIAVGSGVLRTLEGQYVNR
ncbi:MAG: peptidoglycan DD-metalloendopeptidase family protein, partial [Spirochaetia bacterium]